MKLKKSSVIVIPPGAQDPKSARFFRVLPPYQCPFNTVDSYLFILYLANYIFVYSKWISNRQARN